MVRAGADETRAGAGTRGTRLGGADGHVGAVVREAYTNNVRTQLNHISVNTHTGKLSLHSLGELRAFDNTVEGLLGREHSVEVRHILPRASASYTQ